MIHYSGSRFLFEPLICVPGGRFPAGIERVKLAPRRFAPAGSSADRYSRGSRRPPRQSTNFTV